MGTRTKFASARYSWYGHASTGIRVADGNGLILVGEVSDYALDENIEGSAEKNIICGRVNDMNL